MRLLPQPPTGTQYQRTGGARRYASGMDTTRVVGSSGGLLACRVGRLPTVSARVMMPLGQGTPRAAPSGGVEEGSRGGKGAARYNRLLSGPWASTMGE